MIRVDVLGRFRVAIDGVAAPEHAWARRHGAGLVKLLVLAPGRRLHREQVIDALWPDDTPADAAPKLHNAAHFARRALGVADAVVVRGEQIALCPDAESTSTVCASRGGPGEPSPSATGSRRNRPRHRDRYAAARRNTSFSCSRSRMRFFAARSSAFSAALTPGLIASSTSAAVSQFVRHDSEIPKSAATSLSEHRARGCGRPGSRRRGTPGERAWAW